MRAHHDFRGLRRLFVIFAAAGGPIAVLCCGGGDDSGAPKDGGGGGNDGTISNDGAVGRDTGSPSDGSVTDSGGDASACTSSPCVVQIAAGGDQTCALIADGTVRCWGQNTFGEIGVGALVDGGFDASAILSPTQVPGVTGATEIITTDWGRSGGGKAGLGFSAFSCARIGATDVTCWGDDTFGQLGRGDASTGTFPNPTPKNVGITGATQISADGRDICALVAGGALTCWGFDRVGELGLAFATTNESNPTPASFALDAGAATQIALGRYHSCALLASGQVQCWGENGESELGGADAGPEGKVPQLVPGVFNVVELKSSGYTTCGRTSAGAVVCWGRSNMGQLGRDAGVGVDSDGPGFVDLPAGRTAMHIGVATSHACAILDDDSVWCWGRNFSTGNGNPGFGAPGGQIGPSPEGGCTSSPQKINGLAGKVLQIVGGYAHTCALIQGGSVQCWGSNHAGELGTGTADELAHPTPTTVVF